VWHVSVSAWSRCEKRISQPVICEHEAIRLLRGVGGGREWWWWNTAELIGHLRVPITAAENRELPLGVAVDDAGESGPERKRTP
jgi:hypothetical protein